MRILAILLLTATMATAGSEWYTVSVKDSEAVKLIYHNAIKTHVPDPAKDEYPLNYTFPQTNMMYWKKVDTDWVMMTAGERTAKDATLKQEATVTAETNVDMDALFQTIADAVKGNLKTKPEIIAAFKDAVDPKKADKKNKEKNK